ncbi:hypothetical protein BDU57DRAFT_359260 [Ampelomyces quisqualis]|uniref:Uncharacterized protein n=1 Tax=Ampelomyces quisqualis TaxID=50730 RepID=A0A6A5QDJ2_AMPQU|nr:hypothetical protein BDU57DRAFT_359260 [Ampelomyces quisqualis]
MHRRSHASACHEYNAVDPLAVLRALRVFQPLKSSTIPVPGAVGVCPVAAARRPPFLSPSLLPTAHLRPGETLQHTVSASISRLFRNLLLVILPFLPSCVSPWLPSFVRAPQRSAYPPATMPLRTSLPPARLACAQSHRPWPSSCHTLLHPHSCLY